MSVVKKYVNDYLETKGFTEFITDSRTYALKSNAFSLVGALLGFYFSHFCLVTYLMITHVELEVVDISEIYFSPLFLLFTGLMTLLNMIFMGSIGVLLSERVFKLEQKLLDIKNKSETDPLSGLCNRRSFIKIMTKELHRNSRLKDQSQMALIFIDIDFFKKVNDTYGHAAGDIVIQKISKFLESACRPYDTVARWGGEEIVILNPQTSGDQSLRFAERLRQGVEDLYITIDDNRTIQITISIGVAIYTPNGEEMNELIDRADRMLYLAKDNGRNRVEVSESNAG